MNVCNEIMPESELFLTLKKITSRDKILIITNEIL